MEYRELAADDDRFHEFARYAFQPESGPFDPESFDSDDTPGPAGGRRGLFDGDDLLAICCHYWFDVDVRGTSLSAPGLSAVATPPEYRRDGNVRRLLEASLEEYRDRGDAFSLLWPFEAPFYAQYGWATTNRMANYDVDPAALEFATEATGKADAEYTYRQVDADEWAVLDEIDAACWTQTLAVDRGEAFWRHRMFQSWDTDPYVYLVERDDDPVAYVLYYVRDGDDGKRLGVAYHAAVDHEAELALLSFCHVHDSQVETVRLKAPLDWDLAFRLEDPGAVETEVRAGGMARVVDARDALEAVPVRPVTADLVLDVVDPLVDWHDDPIRVNASDGTVTCSTVSAPAEGGRVDSVGGADAGRAAAAVDVTLGVGDLTQVLLGTRTASELARTGEIEGAASAIETLDALYPETDVCLLQFF